jgi:hypothetical protein
MHIRWIRDWIMDWTGISLHSFIHSSHLPTCVLFLSIKSLPRSRSLFLLAFFGSTPRHLWREHAGSRSWLPRRRISQLFLIRFFARQTVTDLVAGWLVAGGYIFGQGTAKKGTEGERRRQGTIASEPPGEEGDGGVAAVTVGHEMSIELYNARAVAFELSQSGHAVRLERLRR